MKKERNIYIDSVKGIAITLVVIGHCIQFGSGSEYLHSGAFFANPVFKFIYSFHMPLFMLISGYLFFFSINRNTWGIIKGKTIGIIIPIISWHTLYQFTIIAMGKPMTPYIFFFSYFHTLWFLRALFYSSILVLIINRLFHDQLWIYTIIFIFMFFLPDRFFPSIFVFTMPYFYLGYLFNKIGGISIIKERMPFKSDYFFSICSLLYFSMLCFFEDDYYAYISKTYLFNNEYTWKFMVFVNIYRHLTASFGCIFVLWFIGKISPLIKDTWITRTITVMSQISLCIYIINHYLNETILIRLPIKDINYGYIALEAVGIIILSYIISLLLKKHKFTRILFLGGR